MFLMVKDKNTGGQFEIEIQGTVCDDGGLCEL